MAGRARRASITRQDDLAGVRICVAWRCGARLSGEFAMPVTTTFTNNTGITIPPGAPGTTSGSTSQTLNVTGLFGTITSITVTLTGLTHAFPDDLDFVLVAPDGSTNLVFMSDAGTSLDINAIDLVISDAAGAALPDATQLVSGTFLPTNWNTGNLSPTESGATFGGLTLNDPAPTGAGTLTGTFGGLTPNGTWTLWVADDFSGDFGSLVSWSITITTPDAPVIPPLPPSSSVPSSGRDEILGDGGANTIAALAGDDVVSGFGGADLLYGNEGNDTIHAGTGNNTVYGGKDNDFIDGADDNDLLFGGEGFDNIDGGEGNNTIVGGNDSADGADSIRAGGGADLIWGNGGNDTVVAGNGANTVIGGFGVDSLVTGADADIVFGNQGNDLINAGGGADLVFGGQGDDGIFGGAGNDTIWGNEGNDSMSGGDGADRYVFAAGSGADQINGFSFSEGDRLSLQGQTFTTGTSADGDVVLTLSGGGTIELNGVTPAAFSPTFVV
jgi:Ca2+-binding RTX toxin-like protein